MNINGKPNNLRQVQKQLEQTQIEAERLEKEARLLKVKDKLQIIFDKLTNNDDVTVWLEKNTKTDARILAKSFIDSFEIILSNASDDLQQENLRRQAINERRNRENSERRRTKQELEKKKYAEAFPANSQMQRIGQEKISSQPRPTVSTTNNQQLPSGQVGNKNTGGRQRPTVSPNNKVIADNNQSNINRQQQANPNNNKGFEDKRS
ncbi:hypothetical protein [uncultured Anaerococcus sp.]|uniref:hypothetical protein n=1 Tax=uncultured Anaerococcus sp. TaxID=293428 RepID=UPI00288B9757|nr:hypothetical protein [uncultured Anaerococcus sp.]